MKGQNETGAPARVVIADRNPGSRCDLMHLLEDRSIEERTVRSQERLRAREVIDEAKFLLIQRFGLTEQDACRQMQAESMNRRAPLRSIAEAILNTHSAGTAVHLETEYVRH